VRCGGKPPAPERLSSFPNLPPLFCIAARNSSYFIWLRAAPLSAAALALLPLLLWLIVLLPVSSPLRPLLPRRPLPLLHLRPRLLLLEVLVRRPPLAPRPLVYAAAVLIALLDRVDDDDDDEEPARLIASNAPPPPPPPFTAMPSWLFFLNSC